MIRLSAFSDEAANSLEGQIEALRRNRIVYTELRSIDGRNIKDFSLCEAKKIYKKLSDNGISVWSVGSPLGKCDIDIPLKNLIDDVNHVCALANELHTDKVRIFSFFNAYEKRSKVFDYLGEMVEAASVYGVELYHENEKEIFGDIAARVLDIMRNVSGLKYVYDPANFIQVGEDAGKTLSLLHAKTDYFHIKDVISATGELVPAGLGDGKIAELIDMIKDDKVLTVEPHLKVFKGYADIDASELKGKFVYADNDSAFDAAVDAVKRLLGESARRHLQCGDLYEREY